MSSKPYRRDQLAFIVVVGTLTALVVGIIAGVAAQSVFFGAFFAVVGFGIEALLCGLVFVILHAFDRLSGGVISNPQIDSKVRKIIGTTIGKGCAVVLFLISVFVGLIILSAILSKWR
jgi:hypothetical protein